jgi:hypothetical protein
MGWESRDLVERGGGRDMPPAVGQTEAISAREQAMAIVPRNVMMLFQRTLLVEKLDWKEDGEWRGEEVLIIE